MPEPKPMKPNELRAVPDETGQSVPEEAKRPRRRFTPEERIENRKREIALIEEGRRRKVRVSIEKAEELLTLCLDDTTAAGMELEAKRIADALDALAGNAKAD